MRPAAAAEVRVAVAGNFVPAMEALEAAFEAETGHEVTLAAGSTGKLYAQIVHGAPFDVFLAADEDRPARLEAGGMTVPGSRFTYAVGRIVLWAPDGAANEERLKAGDFRRLAVANPSLAPYGAAAMQVIGAVGVEEALAPKLVLGEDVGQAFAFVRTGNAELGFVALSQILALPEEERGGWWTPAQALYTPVRQDAALLRRGAENEAATAFLDFLRSAAGRAVLERYGYGDGAE